MKVQDIAKELNVDLGTFLSFLRDQGIRQVKPSTKLDPGTTTKVKNKYKSQLEKKNSENIELPEKTVSFNKESIKVSELTTLLEFPMAQIMKVFLQKGLMVNLNSEIDQETLIEVAKELNITIKIEDLTVENELGLKTKVMEIESESIAESNKENQTTRPPVITIMGHVDHGKTLLLDQIRKTNVVDVESGGITQHIGAYQINHNNNKLTFLDTPGHEAFTTLRARGAQITDIAILVVAADDGVKPQTIEAINHAQVADVPIIVAINKIDKPDIDIDNVKQQLSQYNLLAEDWGGKTITVPVSAKTGEGLDSLLEMIELVAELQELKANPKSVCKAVIIESKLSAQKGPIGTVIVKAGTLKVGDYFIIDSHYGKVRAIFNDAHKQIKQLHPGDPGELLGFSEVPQPGSILESQKTEKECRQHIEEHKKNAINNNKNLTQKMSVSLEALSSQAEEGDLRQLNLIIKADVHGSLEAIKGSIEKIESKDIPIKIIHFSTGNITENDVLLAKASNGIIFGFNAEPSSEASRCAQKEKVTIKTYSIIYNILDDIQKVIQGLYKIEFEEIEQSEIQIREMFKFSKVGKIAGCHITKGKVERNDKIRVIRDGNEIFSGEIESLKRFKEDVKEVAEGFECGIVLKGMNDLQVDDIIISYKIKEKKIL
ncbi:MAG: translation initiation factor IF-2 [Actinobacteria bacterium]|nr:translation initiation factor IF-2 [Actinomycetota bacterium]